LHNIFNKVGTKESVQVVSVNMTKRQNILCLNTGSSSLYYFLSDNIKCSCVLFMFVRHWILFPECRVQGIFKPLHLLTHWHTSPAEILCTQFSNDILGDFTKIQKVLAFTIKKEKMFKFMPILIKATIKADKSI